MFEHQEFILGLGSYFHLLYIVSKIVHIHSSTFQLYVHFVQQESIFVVDYFVADYIFDKPLHICSEFLKQKKINWVT